MLLVSIPLSLFTMSQIDSMQHKLGIKENYQSCSTWATKGELSQKYGLSRMPMYASEKFKYHPMICKSKHNIKGMLLKGLITRTKRIKA